MENMEYSKPSMKFVSLRADRAVADTCWGYHGTGTVNYYYDTDGKGFVGFTVDAGSCKLNMNNVLYYEYNGDPEPDPLKEGDPRYDAWYRAISSAGGNSGNPVHGHGSVFVPDQPGPGMS